MSFYTSDAGAQSSAYNLVLQTLATKSLDLHNHLTQNVKGLNHEVYLREFFTGLFTGHLAIDEAARVWDAYVFEGDALLIRAAVAFMLSREISLLAAETVEGVTQALLPISTSERASRAVAEPGAEDRFMKAIREVGR